MTNDRSGHVRGFWAACWTYRRSIAVSWDFIGAFVAAGLAMYLPSDEQVRGSAQQLAPAALGLASALVGVVVAGLAVVVVFMDDQFLGLIQEKAALEGGVERLLFPFWFVTATGVTAILASLVLLLVGPYATPPFPRMLMAVTVLMVVWTSIGVFNLVAFLQATGVSRAIYARLRKG